MRFDVLLGNPPFQHPTSKSHNVKLWPQFVRKSIELLKPDGFISLVTPDSLWRFDTSICRRQRASVLTSVDLSKVISSDDYFSVGCSISRWFGNAGPYSGSTEVFGDSVDLSQGPWLSEEGKVLDGIHKKVLAFSPRLPLRESNHVAAHQCVGGPTPIYVSGQKLLHTDLELSDVGAPKLVAPWSCSPYKRFHTTEAVGMFNFCMPCSVDEFAVLTPIWDLKVVRLFLSTWQKTAGFTPGVHRMPDLRGMDDAEAYEALGLTADEIAFVEERAS